MTDLSMRLTVKTPTETARDLCKWLGTLGHDTVRFNRASFRTLAERDTLPVALVVKVIALAPDYGWAIAELDSFYYGAVRLDTLEIAPYCTAWRD